MYFTFLFKHFCKCRVIRLSELWEIDHSLIADLPVDSCPTNHFGAVLFADFDADGIVDIGLPCCADVTCRKVVVINVWNHYIGAWQDFHITGLEVNGTLLFQFIRHVFP